MPSLVLMSRWMVLPTLPVALRPAQRHLMVLSLDMMQLWNFTLLCRWAAS